MAVALCKRCRRCSEVRPLEEFYASKKSEDGHIWRCRQCCSEVAAEWNRQNPERHQAHVERWKMKARYGITPEQRDALIEAQGGGCAICGRQPPAVRLVIDHCHAKGHVRGVLCHPCNAALGLAEDNPNRLRRAVAYLEASPPTAY